MVYSSRGEPNLYLIQLLGVKGGYIALLHEPTLILQLLDEPRVARLNGICF